MPTTTRVEAIVIDSDDGSSTFFRNDGDLVVDLKKGRAVGVDQLGVVLVKLGIDDYRSVHEVRIDAYSPLGSPIDVLDLAIEQLTTAINALRRIQDGEDINAIERNAFHTGVDAHAAGLVKAKSDMAKETQGEGQG